MLINILTRSSSGDPYTVSVESDGFVVSVLCNCPAGSLAQNCKHKAHLIVGDAELLFDESQLELFKEAARICGVSGIAAAYEEMARIEAEIKVEEERLKKRRTSVKAAFARKLADGFPAES